MRIATFNCNSVRKRINIIIDWLEKYQPDVLALQETKATDADFPAASFKDAGWLPYFRGEKSYNGVAMIVKKEPKEISFGLGDDDGASQTRFAKITIKGMTLFNSYVPQGQEIGSEKFAFKLRWFERVGEYFSRHLPRGAKAAWVGDLNVAPEPMDVYDSKAVWPHVCHCAETIAAFRSVTDGRFVDIFRRHIPDPGNFTFWDYRQRGALDRNRGWRIDHILATPSMAERSISCAVDMEPRRLEGPSDHTFVYADFSE